MSRPEDPMMKDWENGERIDAEREASMPIYHWKDNWFFKRGADGTVVVRHDNKETHRPDVSLLIPPNEWASIIASVSARGETAEQYAAATDFHNGRAGQ